MCGSTLTLVCAVNLAFCVSNEDGIKFDILFGQLDYLFYPRPFTRFGLWRTVGGFGGFNPHPPKFWSFDKAEPNSQFRGKYIRNYLVFLFHHPN
jgi:hypothetical protein